MVTWGHTLTWLTRVLKFRTGSTWEPPLFPGTLQTLVLSPKPSQSAILQWLFMTISFIHSAGIYWARLSTMLKRYQGKSSPSLRGVQTLLESCPYACERRGVCFLLTPQQSHSVRGFLQTLTSLHFLLSLSFSKQGFMKVQFLRSRHWASFAGCAHEDKGHNVHCLRFCYVQDVMWSPLHTASHFILTNTVQGRRYPSSCLTNEETKAQSNRLDIS